MQTIDGEQAQGMCREEFQWFVLYFLHPLLEKCVKDRLAAEENSIEVYDCGEGEYKLFKELVDSWKSRLKDAYKGLEEKKWYGKGGGGTAKWKVPIECYSPSTVPYFVSFDNAPAHSFWVVRDKVHLARADMGPGLLQCIRICPQGHDIHQIPEHAIGVIKGHCKKELSTAMKTQNSVDNDLVYDAVQAAAANYTSESLDGNLVRLDHALKVISSEKTELVEFFYHKQWHYVYGTAGSYAPMFLS